MISLCLFNGCDRTSAATDRIVAPERLGDDQARRHRDVILARTLLVRLRRRTGLRAVRPEEVIEQTLVVFEPVRLEGVRFGEDPGVLHYEGLVAAEKLALLDLEGRVVGAEPEVPPGPAELERDRRVEPEGLVDDGLDEVEVLERVEAEGRVAETPNFLDDALLESGVAEYDAEERREEYRKAAVGVEAEDEEEVVDRLLLAQPELGLPSFYHFFSCMYINYVPT